VIRITLRSLHSPPLHSHTLSHRTGLLDCVVSSLALAPPPLGAQIEILDSRQPYTYGLPLMPVQERLPGASCHAEVNISRVQYHKPSHLCPVVCRTERPQARVARRPPPALGSDRTGPRQDLWHWQCSRTAPRCSSCASEAKGRLGRGNKWITRAYSNRRADRGTSEVSAGGIPGWEFSSREATRRN
jgi:hypothetical protein